MTKYLSGFYRMQFLFLFKLRNIKTNVLKIPLTKLVIYRDIHHTVSPKSGCVPRPLKIETSRANRDAWQPYIS